MKKDLLKFNLPLYFLLIAGNSFNISKINATPATNVELIAKLFRELGPERTQLFIQRLEQKQPQQKLPVMPPIAKPMPKSIEIPTPMIPMIPIPEEPKKPSITESLKGPEISPEQQEKLYDTIANLQLYTMQIYDCVKAFFNKSNSEPYRSHVNCFKKQLLFIQNHIRNVPKATTTETKKLLDALYKIATSLEKSQAMMVKTLDRDYVAMPLGSLNLGGALSQLEGPVNKQRTIINQQIGILRSELRKVNAADILEAVNKLNNMMNETFNYGNTKKVPEMMSILSHRLKR